MSIKTRFAPSPTGYLHIGGARTALFSWLYAHKMKSTFILRIEDTDQERSTQASVDAIFAGMEWLNLNYDETPVYQTQRFDRYAEVIQQLLDEGKAYRCYCSRERLDTLREQQMANKEKPRYDGKCRDLNSESETNTDGDYVIRFRNPKQGVVEIDDLVRGNISIANRELDDLIIARSDGTPTYNLTVVVDDLDMGISHVIRGDDHINNTPRQINIMHALGATPPKYAHVPMILGADGKRLSKRHGAVGVMQYRDEGYLPQALLNYLVRLGWSHGDQEVFSREEMIHLFSLEGVNKSPSTFNPEKLLWLNQHYLKTLDLDEIATHLNWHLEQQQLDISNGPAITEVIAAQRERAKTLVDLVANSRYFYEDFASYNVNAAKKHFKTATPDILQAMHDALAALEQWEESNLHQAIMQVCEQLGIKLGKLGSPLRVAITGSAMSPSLEVTLKLIGKERALQRILKAIAFNRAKYA